MDEPALRTILRNIILPPTGPLLLVIAGLLLSRSRRLPRAGMALAIAGLAMLWVLSTPAFSGYLLRWVQHATVLDLSRSIDAGAVVILGGGTRTHAPEYGGPAPDQLTLQRLAYGARVARATGLPILVTGGGREGAAMAEFLTNDFGLPPRWIEQRARNTRENAALSAPLLASSGVQSIVLVTSALHMHRATEEFEAQGLRVVAAPVDVAGPHQPTWSDFIPGLAALRESHYALYELLGMLVARITGGGPRASA
jgi:uncharacterized SAM-binding protein YcdF (DUF218 family)